jgi:Flp pilus assembly protein TadD
MKSRYVVAALLSVAVIGSACATNRAPAPAPTAMAGFSAAQMERILTLREGGESLAAVAKEVGGNRDDVRLAERQYRRQLRAQSVVSPTLAIELPR